jgi:hypothetical protein
MKDSLQSGSGAAQHLDADQLSAFAEQALPLHERESVLAHLAVCPACRATLALAQAIAGPAEAPEPRTWATRYRIARSHFSGWNLLLPAASLAVAVLATFVVYFSHPANQPTKNAQQQMAALEAPAKPSTELASPPAPATRTTGQLTNRPAIQDDKSIVAPPAASASRSLATPHAKKDMPLPQFAAANLPASQNIVALDQSLNQAVQPAAPPETAAQPSNSRSEPVPAESTPSAALREDAAAGAVAAQGTVQAFSLRKAALAPVVLPSSQPILSLARQGQHLLAIDNHNAVFLSADGGATWQSIPSAWTGRAVKADLVTYSIHGALAGRGGAAPALLAAPPVAPPLRDEITAKETAASALSGIVTDAAGAAVANARITVTNPTAQITLTTTTGPDGRYRIANLPDGAYTIKAQSPGFETHTSTGVPIANAHPNTANIVLQIGTATQTVTVEADSLQTEREPKSALKTAPAPKPASPPQVAPVFQITTDNGDRWTSTDGQTWSRQ